jgi:hypothetical protein
VGEITHLPKIDILASTAQLWVKERERLGEEALRSTRKASSTLVRNPKLSAADLSHLTDQSNPEHKLHYAEKVKLLPEKPSEQTLRRYCSCIGAKSFQKPYITKVSNKNKPIRVAYGEEYMRKRLS